MFKKNLNASKPSEHPPQVECCCFSHSAHWLPTRKKLLYTVANPARGLLNREKKKKKKSGSAPPPPPRAARSEKKKKKKKKITRPIHMSRRYASRRYARWSRSVSHPYKDSYDSSARPMGVASQNSRLPCAIATNSTYFYYALE